MPATADISIDLVQSLPHLRMVARMLTRDGAVVDDLVQETALRALNHADQFQPGTNLRAWLTTILRNFYFSERRNAARRPWVDIEGLPDGMAPSIRGAQEGCIRMIEFNEAFEALPKGRQEALALVGAYGYSYEDAAEKVGCAVGTMKSRVSRARLEISRLLGDEAEAPTPTHHESEMTSLLQ